ncbi:uncharacterized protein DUF5134 [Actinomycetospora succinea]|uniref:Uncharacterized protein DUF5134 n=1 Tax=Actinomycetospora succinea TaxID=663603 RepID=A0A4R6VL24_9PSEU|nr:DUF5134 domain-containing protein [Actinomycetospora succinea]TDQ62551.1 uncharacterized protein DUF5134 [Actinomycetospora succinea]
MFSAPLAGAFTALFVLTGAYAFVRYVRITTGATHAARGSDGEARAVELLHLLMSIAMIAMAWGWSGGPTSGSGVVQLVVFGVLTVLFGGLAAVARDRGRAVSRAAHALMSGAMVWMVATMPLLMGHSGDDGGSGGGHAGHGGSEAADGAAMVMPPAPAPGWVVVATVVLALLLAAAAVRWGVAVVRASTRVDVPTPPEVTADGGGVSTLVATPVRTVRTRRGGLAASCHALMSLGMAAMLLAML